MKKESKNLKSITERKSNDKSQDNRIYLSFKKEEIDQIYLSLKLLKPITDWLIEKYEEEYKIEALKNE